MNKILSFLRCNSCIVVAGIFLIAGFGATCRAQSSEKIEKHSRKIEKKLTRYRTGSLVQVDFRDSSQALGTLGDVSDATFQVTNTESNKVQTFNYADVTHVSKTKEYIGAGSGPEHHFHHWVPVLVVAAAAGGGIAAYEAIR
jgi:hypothetical protein